MQPRKPMRALSRVSSLAIVAALSAAAAQAAPEAGSVIGNQAVATYVNGVGDTITVTSNKVETIVQQVAGLTLTADNNETIAPGGKAFLTHTIVNDGNGPDSYSLSATEVGGDFDFSSVVFYADQNLDGVADSTTPITETPVLAAGERFGVVIDVTVPASATAGSESLTVTASSVFDGTVTASNTDTLTISTGAIMDLTKSMVVDKSAGDPTIVDAGDTVTVTLTYSNTGLAASTNYSVQDVLDGDLIYVPGSAQWSDRIVAGGLDETNGAGIDATNGQGDTMAFEHGANIVDFTISNVAAGRTGSVTFEATISSLAAAGLIENIATQSDSNGALPSSNTSAIMVDEVYRALIGDTYTEPGPIVVTSSTDDGAAGDDVVLESDDTTQGGQIEFEFVIGNDSNDTDSYTLDLSNNSFPAGTTFQIVGSDGVTPVVGSVGPLLPGESTLVTVIATLPADATPTAAGSTNYSATVTTTSDSSGVSDDSTALFTGAVLATSVDLENVAAGLEGDGDAPDNGGLPWVSLNTDPGQPITFPMNIENLGPTGDSYTLTLAAPLPAGWTVEFQLADGTTVTNTGTIPSLGSTTINVIVTPDEGALPGGTTFEVVATSPVSGQGDSIINEVVVNEIVDVAIAPDQTVQAAPGGIVDILHTLTNEGNVAITDGSISASGLSTFSGAIYWDQNGDGVLDAGDPQVSNLSDLGGLAPGQTATLIYRVQVASVPGVAEVATLSLGTSLNGGSKADGDTADNAAIDSIRVVSGDMTLVKSQAIDPACDGTVGAFSQTQQAVEPGQCIRYRIVAENTGSEAVSGVTINDIVPAYTAFETCGGACDATVTPVTATANTASAPQLSSTHGTLLPGESGSLEFTVRVDN